jgi:hypothetical protein
MGLQEESDDIHKEITDLYNMTEATVHTHIVQSVRRWPQPRSPHGPWSREDSESPSPMRHARRSLHTVEDATEVSGSPSGMSLTLSEVCGPPLGPAFPTVSGPLALLADGGQSRSWRGKESVCSPL